MKLYQKNALILAMTLLLLTAVLCGCTQKTVATAKETPATAKETPAAAENAMEAAVALVSDISTTQYFTDEAVKEADVKTIVQAGIQTPSAMNGQPWHFSVITDAQVLQSISGGMGGGMPFGGGAQPAPGEMTPPEGMEMPEGFAPPEGMELPEGEMPAAPGGGSGGAVKAGITDAPLVIVISCKDGSQLDAGLACQNMSVTAQLLGYGTKIVTSPTMALNGANQDTFRELLGIPEGYSAAAVLLIGREDTSVDETMDGYTGATARNALEDMVTYVTADGES